MDPAAGFLESDQEFKIIQDSILFVHKHWCVLWGYVIMPDHSHLVIQPRPESTDLASWCDYTQFYPVEGILGSIKKHTAREINKLRRRTGNPLWQDESYDRTVRNEKDLENLIDYIHGNPVRWKLVERPEDYPWSSAGTIYSGKREYAGWFDEEDETE
jgi:REP element-mobilizing transposase RayT